jgi:hypothetical protein
LTAEATETVKRPWLPGTIDPDGATPENSKNSARSAEEEQKPEAIF